MNLPLSPSRVISVKLQQQADRRPANRLRGRRNQASGTVGQNAIEWRLREIGVLMVEAVHTPWIIRWHQGKPVSAVPGEKVSGDFRGVLAGGTSVLVEVKRVEHLVFSEFKDHQVKNLNEHQRIGGVSLIGWSIPGGDAYVLRWPVPGFVPRTSLAIETAKQLNVTRIRQ